MNRTGEIRFTAEEQAALEKGPQPPFRLTAHWASLMGEEPDDPLRRQVVPDLAEWNSEESEREDPLGENDHSPLPRLIRRYRDRALVVMTGQCAMYCRHCFRRRLTGSDYGHIRRDEARNIGRWLGDHPEVTELLLSGGDPLSLPFSELVSLTRIFRQSRPDLVLRLATRMPIVDPRRITRKIARRLGRLRPIWIVIQCNHPREVSPEFLRVLDRLQRRGLPVLNQAVLLRGVNDSVEVLESLSRKLVSAGVKPYYLFQGDVARGTGHFRLPLDEARMLVDQLRGRLSGLAMPNFSVDLPGGAGKVPLGRDYVKGKTEGAWLLETPDGQQGYYPDPGVGSPAGAGVQGSLEPAAKVSQKGKHI